MRACVLTSFGSVDNLQVQEVADPVPGPGELLIDVRAAGVTYADLLVIEGKYQVLPKIPFAPGKEISGIVAAIGPGVEKFKPGMHVMGFAELGGYAERAVVAQNNCFALPPSMPFTDAAAMGIAYQTAYMALMDRGQYRQGESVLVNGASGGVGLAAVQLAKAMGATVLAGLTTPGKAATLSANGADHIIDLSRPDIAKSLRDQVYAVTQDRGVDIVLDPLGGDVFDAALRALAWRGRAVVIGFVSDRIPTVKTNYLLIKNIAVSGLYWGSYSQHARDEINSAQQDLLTLYAAGKLKPVIMETFSLPDVRRAFNRISSRQVLGRILLEPNK
jgi:NADPH2:quinone reductase